jgi:Uma2 family endonuclease
MRVTAKLPKNLAERLQQGGHPHRIPASWADYVDLLSASGDLPVEYDLENIIYMGIASDNHEAIVANIIICLGSILGDVPDMYIRGSNRHVYLPDFQKDYAPDVHVIQGAPEVFELRKGLTANTNPWLVVEVLSPSTYVRDMQEKLPFYKKIPSLRHILYVEQDRPLVTVMNRVGDSAVWETIDLDRPEDAFPIAGQSVYLKEVYKKVTFGAPQSMTKKPRNKKSGDL